MGETSRTKLDFEELEFYTDLAMNECQRWLEAVTREPFSEPDDFLLSLRKGRQLQKLLNLLIPGAISIQQQHHKNDAPHSPKQRQLHRSHSDNKTWITKFLYICRSSLGLKEHQLFRISDLDPEKCSSIEGHSPADSVASDLILCKIRRVIVTLHQLAKLSQSAEYKNLHINNVSLSSANGCSSPTTIPEIDFTALEPLIGSRELFNGDDEDEEQQQLLLQKQNEQEKILDFMTVLHEEEEGEEKQSSLKMDIISRSRSINGHNLNEKYANMAKNINENGRNEILDYCQEEKDGGYWSEKVSSFERSIVDNPASPTGVKKFEFNLDFEEKTVLKNQNILQMTSSESLKIVEEVETRENDRKLSSENSDKNGKFSTTFDDDDNDDDSPDDFRRLSDDDEGGDMTPLEASNYNYRKMSDAPKKSQSSIKGVRDDNGQEIPTRKGSKNTNLNSSTKEALKYVKVKSILDDTAKKQISIVEEQKKFIGLEVIKTDKDEEWKNDLENWTKKRKLIRVKAEKTFDDFRNAALHNGARKPYDSVNGQERMDRLKSDNHELGNGESYLSNEKDGINNNHKMSKSLNGKFGRHFSESSATVDDRFNERNFDDKESLVSRVNKCVEVNGTAHRLSIDRSVEDHRESTDSVNFTVILQPTTSGFGFTCKTDDQKSILIDDSADDSPARTAGLSTGDRLLEINGRPVSQAPMDIVDKLLKEATRSGRLELKISRCQKTKIESKFVEKTVNTDVDKKQDSSKIKNQTNGLQRHEPIIRTPAIEATVQSVLGKNGCWSDGVQDEAFAFRQAQGLSNGILSRNIDQPDLSGRMIHRRNDSQDSTELNYFKLAALCTSPSTKDRNESSIFRFDKNNQDINNHWLIKETEHMRLTDQLKNERDQEMRYNGNSATNDEPKSKNTLLKTRCNGTKIDERSKSESNNNNLRTGSYETDSEDQDGVVTLSEQQNCSHCGQLLGHGAAMTIESLQLYFHITCFRCYVCQAALGDGSRGTDVRVKQGKLHCQQCYNGGANNGGTNDVFIDEQSSLL